jgi:hypothetical protein
VSTARVQLSKGRPDVSGRHCGRPRRARQKTCWPPQASRRDWPPRPEAVEDEAWGETSCMREIRVSASEVAATGWTQLRQQQDGDVRWAIDWDTRRRCGSGLVGSGDFLRRVVVVVEVEWWCEKGDRRAKMQRAGRAWLGVTCSRVVAGLATGRLCSTTTFSTTTSRRLVRGNTRSQARAESRRSSFLHGSLNHD